MNGQQYGRIVLASLVLGLSPGWTALAGRMVVLDPGVTDARTTEPAMTDMLVEPGAWARLDMALGEYRIEVMGGQVSVVFTDTHRTLSAGETRLIPAGTAFGLLNTGASPAHLRISVALLQQARQSARGAVWAKKP